VTMVATGLGGAVNMKQRARTSSWSRRHGAHRTDNVGMPAEHINYDDLGQPAVVRRGRASASGGASASGFDAADIPRSCASRPTDGPGHGPRGGPPPPGNARCATIAFVSP